MRYFFNGKVEQQDGIYQIKIPFNVWEVCKKRDIIDANIILDDLVVECELLPAKNSKSGTYIIHLMEESVSHLDMDSEHRIEMQIHESLIEIPNSPYSLEQPVRKIDGIELIIQPVDGLCSQTCVAMLAGVTIGDVVSVIGLREWQAMMGNMVSALDYYGIGHSNTVIFTEGRETVLPKCCIMMEKMGLYCHYLLHYDGKFYDPNVPVFERYDLSKLQGYLEVTCE